MGEVGADGLQQRRRTGRRLLLAGYTQALEGHLGDLRGQKRQVDAVGALVPPGDPVAHAEHRERGDALVDRPENAAQDAGGDDRSHLAYDLAADVEVAARERRRQLGLVGEQQAEAARSLHDPAERRLHGYLEPPPRIGGPPPPPSPARRPPSRRPAPRPPPPPRLLLS